MHRYRLPAVSASYPPQQQDDDDPLMGEPVFDGDEELGPAEEGQMIPYAHRDIKPGRVAFNSRNSIESSSPRSMSMLKDLDSS